MHGFGDPAWLIWLGVALVAGVLEVLSVDFVFLMFAAGAVGASLVAALGAGVTLQVVTFGAVSTALMLGVRPPIKRWARRTAPVTRTGIDALPGRAATALTAVDHRGGTIKLAGETWTARTEDDTVLVEPGSSVEIVMIDGATAVVRLRPLPPTPPDPSSLDTA